MQGINPILRFAAKSPHQPSDEKQQSLPSGKPSGGAQPKDTSGRDPGVERVPDTKYGVRRTGRWTPGL